MKTLLTVILLTASLVVFSQKDARKYDATFISIHVDPNQLIKLKDNPRTEREVKGLNYRIEVGAMGKLFEGYIFYEDFSAIKYTTYGAGFNAVLTPSEDFFITAGLNYGFITRDYWGNGSAAGVGFQSKVGYHITRNLAAIGEIEYKKRGDLNNLGIVQGKIGIRFFITNKGRDGWRFK